MMHAIMDAFQSKENSLQLLREGAICSPTEELALDVVVPAAPKDYPKVRACVEGLLRHSLTPIGRVHVVSESRAVVEELAASHPITWIDEARYPFTKRDVSRVLEDGMLRVDIFPGPHDVG
jgi:hypothetical protein